MLAIIFLGLGIVIGASVNAWIMLLGPILAVSVWLVEYQKEC